MKKHLTVLAKLTVMILLLGMLYRNVDFVEFRAALGGLQGARVGVDLRLAEDLLAVHRHLHRAARKPVVRKMHHARADLLQHRARLNVAERSDACTFHAGPGG